jgi:hypothetical protein
VKLKQFSWIPKRLKSIFLIFFITKLQVCFFHVWFIFGDRPSSVNLPTPKQLAIAANSTKPGEQWE